MSRTLILAAIDSLGRCEADLMAAGDHARSRLSIDFHRLAYDVLADDVRDCDSV